MPILVQDNPQIPDFEIPEIKIPEEVKIEEELVKIEEIEMPIEKDDVPITDKNIISPGTEFSAELAKHLECFIRFKLNTDPVY